MCVECVNVVYELLTVMCGWNVGDAVSCERCGVSNWCKCNAKIVFYVM